MSNGISLTRAFVVLGLARTFAEAGGNPAPAFEALGLPHPADLAIDELLPATAYYALLEDMTRRLGDPFFPARAGVAMARSGLPVLVEARNRSGTLAECLLRIIAVYRSSVTNAHYELMSDGRKATVTLKRAAASRSTSRVDVLNAAAFVTLLRDEMAGGPMTGLSVGIPHPEDLPGDIVEPSAVFRKPDGGMALSFPADWLLKPIRVRWTEQPMPLRLRSDEAARLRSLDFVRERIRERLVIGPVSLASIARDLGVSERRLQRSLRTKGTSFRKVLAQERLETARYLVSTTGDALAHVAQTCGFSSPQAFSRAFSGAFGQSPSGYRERNGKP